MEDLIDRQTAYDVLTGFYHHTTDVQHNALREALNKVPSVERHGKWLHKNSTFKNRWLCSECGYTWYFDTKEASYCPHCGATMRGE